VEPSVNPTTDKGLQVRKEDATGCLNTAPTVATAPESDANRYQQVHTWLTPAMPAGTNVQLDGEGTLSLWTKTINGAIYEGRFCVWLIVRDAAGTGTTAAVNQSGTLAGQSYFQYQQPQWPFNWTEISIPLDFTLGSALTDGTRLGIVLTAERTWTGGDGLEILYDEPSFDSRLEVDTDDTVPTFVGP
jgi:hypothetical protein